MRARMLAGGVLGCVLGGTRPSPWCFELSTAIHWREGTPGGASIMGEVNAGKDMGAPIRKFEGSALRGSRLAMRVRIFELESRY